MSGNTSRTSSGGNLADSHGSEEINQMKERRIYISFTFLIINLSTFKLEALYGKLNLYGKLKLLFGKLNPATEGRNSIINLNVIRSVTKKFPVAF